MNIKTETVQNQSSPFRDVENGKEKIDHIDYKMVTFTLGGKDYGIDIMKIKEIAKFGQFTYVPNSPPFVQGVYNLRGDIISIIDLRILFNLPADTGRKNVENGLILRLNDYIIGIVVDSIDKVVGISSADIQPPHPIFGDINIKYIEGVVENDGRLYIILDTERILGKGDLSLKEETSARSPSVASPQVLTPPSPAVKPSTARERDFIAETLGTFSSFFVTSINSAWFENRFHDWKNDRTRKGKEPQLESADEAKEFLRPFYSPFTGGFWSDEYAASFQSLFDSFPGKIVSIWNPGCGRGFESYSVAALFMQKFPDNMIKLWANDNDLIAISTAPTLVMDGADIPNHLKPYSVLGKNGTSFKALLKDRIFFEYHDVLHANTLPDLDVVLARDLVSFLDPESQEAVFEEFYRKLKPKGILVLGSHEEPLDAEKWEKIDSNQFSAYKKIAE